MTIIYEWACDVNRYQWVEWMDDTYGESYEPFSGPEPFADRWRIRKLIRAKNAGAPSFPMSDSPHSYTCVRVISGRAVEALRPLLEPCCEFLPLESDLGAYWAIHVTSEVDCVDLERSRLRRYDNGLVAQIYDWSFHLNRLPDGAVFRVPEDFTTILCNETFAQAVDKHRLLGFRFYKLWSSEGGPVVRDCSLLAKRPEVAPAWELKEYRRLREEIRKVRREDLAEYVAKREAVKKKLRRRKDGPA